MNEQFKQNDPSASPQSNQDVLALIKKIQDHLVILERKIDVLSQRPPSRPFQDRPYEKKSFSKPYRAYGNSSYRGKGEYDNKPREGGFRPGGPFKKREGDDNRGFSHKKKPFYNKHKDRA